MTPDVPLAKAKAKWHVVFCFAPLSLQVGQVGGDNVGFQVMKRWESTTLVSRGFSMPSPE